MDSTQQLSPMLIRISSSIDPSLWLPKVLNSVFNYLDTPETSA